MNVSTKYEVRQKVFFLGPRNIIKETEISKIIINIDDFGQKISYDIWPHGLKEQSNFKEEWLFPTKDAAKLDLIEKITEQ